MYQAWKRRDLPWLNRIYNLVIAECEAGVEIGVASIEDVVDKILSQEFWKVRVESRHQHDELDREI